MVLKSRFSSHIQNQVGNASSDHSENQLNIGGDCCHRSTGVRSMRRIRFSIASLLVVVLVLGVGFAALRESNELWDSGLSTLTLAVLLTSILLAIHRTESR